MNRYFLFISIFLCSVFSLGAQEYFQLQNSDFEKWENPVSGAEEPVMWNTYATAGGSLGSMVNSNVQCAKSTEVRPGSTGLFSAAVKARKVFLSIVANGMLTTGQIEGNSASASDESNHNITRRATGYASPFTGRPDSICAWLKTSFKSKSQMGRFYFVLHGDYDTQDPGTKMSEVVGIAGDNVKYSDNWQRMSIPVFYEGETLNILNEGGMAQRTPACKDARPSYCLASIATNYLPGKGDASDILYVDDLAMIYNSKLSSITIDGTPLAGFNKDKYSYTIAKSYDGSNVVCVSDGKFAEVNQSYDATSSVLTITVKGDDYPATGNKHTYTISFAAAVESCDALLTSFKVNGSSISDFSSSVKSYSLSEVYSNVSSSISYTSSECATVSPSWNESAQTLTLLVASKDGYESNSNTYSFKFHAPYGSQLSSLSVGGTAVSGFSPSTYSYTVKNAYNASDLKYTVDEDATVESAYDEKTYKLTLTVKGGDYAVNSKNVHTYTIQYHAPYGSQLTDLKVFGTTILGFSSSKYEYNLSSDYAYYEDKVAYTADADATVENSYNSSNNILTLKVKGGDYSFNSSNVHTYNILFHAPYASLLSSLSINGTPVASFSSSKLDYSVKSTYTEGTTKITYTASENATVSTSYDATSNVYKLVVKGGDYDKNSENIHTYTIAFHDSYGSQLVDLKNNGTTIEGFSPTVYEYTLKETLSASSINYVADDEATVEKSVDEANYKMTLTVKGGDIAENEANKHVYTIQFHAPYGSSLKALSVNGTSVPNFSPSTYSYSVDDAYAAGITTFTADVDAKVTESYDDRTNVLSITVEGGDIATNKTNKHIYKIQFHAAYGAKLTSLKVNGTSVAGFSSNVFEYSVSSAYDKSKTSITYTADEGATVDASFDDATNTYVIVVKGGDYATNKTNINTYKIEFHDSYGSQLRSLSVAGKPVEGFSPSVYEYTLKNVYDASSLTYVTDPEATVEATSDAKNYTVTLKVKGGDYADNKDNVHTYTILFHAPYASLLTSLSINDKPVAGFSSNTLNYSVEYTYSDETSIKYTTSEDATASYAYDNTTNSVVITVLGGDIETNPDNKRVYIISFHESYGSQLKTLKIDRVEVADFAPNKYTYYVAQNHENVLMSYDVDAEASFSESYDEAAHMATITVMGGDYAQNPSNKHVYKVYFCAPALLKSLLVDGKSVPNFRETKFAYTLSTTTYENVKVTYTAYDGDEVETSYDEETSLLTLKVKGPDMDVFPTNFSVYTIQFHASYDSHLTGLFVDDNLIDGFNRNTLNYVVPGAYKDYKITYTAEATVKALPFNEETNVLTLVVSGYDIAENPNNTHTYKVQFYAPSKLTTLRIGGSSVAGFSPSVYEYDLNASAYGDARITYYAEAGASVDTTFDATKNLLSIRVEGKDADVYPDNFHTYQLQFSKPFDPQLEDLIVDGSSIASFDAVKYSYIYDAIYKDVTVKAVPVDDRSKVTMVYDENTFVLTVRVEAGNYDKVPTNYREYRIEFNDPTVYNSKLQSISMNGALLNGFNKDVFEYDIEGSLTDMTITYLPDEKATVSEKFDAATNTLKLVVSGGNIQKDPTNTHTYSLKFTAQFSFESYVTSLSIGGIEQSTFNKNQYEYDLNCQSSDITFAVSSLAQYCADYDKESGVMTIVVWGGDFKDNPSDFHTYKIKCKK